MRAFRFWTASRRDCRWFSFSSGEDDLPMSSGKMVFDVRTVSSMTSYAVSMTW